MVSWSEQNRTHAGRVRAAAAEAQLRDEGEADFAPTPRELREADSEALWTEMLEEISAQVQAAIANELGGEIKLSDLAYLQMICREIEEAWGFDIHWRREV